MSSGSETHSRYRWPLALTLWYSTLFVLGSIVIVLLTYFLTAASLAQRDQQIIQAKVGEYAAIYSRGGVRALAATVQAEQRTAPERLFVRVVSAGSEAIIFSDRGDWDPASLETASLRLLDGTLVEVGKSTEAREDILSRFRAVLGVVTLSIVVIALTGGWIATQSALRPIRQLATAVRRVITTGHIDERVPTGPHDDDIDELTRLFNEMLEKIERLVTGMRGALDNVSHDLRTPLTRLRGVAEMALAGQPDPERYREALADAVEESDRVLVMLNTLMDISEAESGAMPLHCEPVRLSDVAERAVELYREVAEGKDVTLDVKTSGEAVVSADRVRLEQVAANLVDNAVKYTPTGGHVSVEVLSEENRGLLRVRDSGAGIPADELPHIWDRLFRGDVSRAERGLGLGLSLVKAIVEAHRGTVTVESQPGRGTTFTVALPSPEGTA
jgi:signal transduction histidine kinase